MTYLQLFFISYACFGDVGLIGLSFKAVPQPIRPVASLIRVGNYPPACAPVFNVERPLTPAVAHKRIREIGPSGAPKLQWCERFKCRDRKIEWSDRLVVDGQEVK